MESIMPTVLFLFLFLFVGWKVYNRKRFNIKGRVAVITGAGSGIGSQLAILLAKNGANVALVDVNEKGLEETRKMVLQANQLSDVQCYMCDVSDEERVKILASQIYQHYDRSKVSILVNNAGVFLLLNDPEKKKINISLFII